MSVLSGAAVAVAVGCTGVVPPIGEFDPSDTDLTSQPSPTVLGTPFDAEQCDPQAENTEFDDHSVVCIESADEFFATAGTRIGTSVVKFDIMAFFDDKARHVHFLDSTFYKFHDEWLWYRLLNGQRFEFDSTYEPLHSSFDTIESVYTWASLLSAELPLDLRWSGDRLYSGHFYKLALEAPRELGAGVLIHFPARDSRPASWAFELEFSDKPTYEELVIYFGALEKSLTSDITSNLHWLVRSADQEKLAQDMQQNELDYADRVLRYSQLSVPGETEVYNEGIAAGRLKIVRSGGSYASLTPDNLVVLEEIPDYLPPGSALVTSVPQTPLAHINLLARSRGILNLSVGGITEDPNFDQWSRVAARVALRATAPDIFEAVELTKQQYTDWLSLGQNNEKTLPTVDASSLDYTVDLATLTIEEATKLKLAIGGKSAGMVAVMSGVGVTYPDAPLAVTARAFIEHMEPLTNLFHQMLETEEFGKIKGVQKRYLVLEGEAAYDLKYPGNAAVKIKKSILEQESVLTLLVEAGGVRRMVMDLQPGAERFDLVQQELVAHFEFLSPQQGLRFRSSSTVEDIEGFNGAGLYSSHTGYLFPDELASSDDARKTVEHALRQTWASYWGSEAFEERMAAKVDHLSGTMPVLVHPRFDDAYELSNGVAITTRMPLSSEYSYVTEINVQRGDTSVTNPDGGSLPEIVTVAEPRSSGAPQLTRIRYSSLSPSDTAVYEDHEFLAIHSQAVSIVDTWLSSQNIASDVENERSTLTLDFEFREMAGQWPAYSPADHGIDRILMKQARSLDPDVGVLPSYVKALPVPHDILSRARKVQTVTCESDEVSVSVTETYTDPFAFPDFGYNEQPFAGRLVIRALADLERLGLTDGDEQVLTHLDFETVNYGLTTEASNDYAVEIRTTEGFQHENLLVSLAVSSGGVIELATTTDESVRFVVGGCKSVAHFTTPDEFLSTLLDNAQ